MKVFKIRCSQINKIMGASKTAGGLSQTAITYLKEWYAGDQEEVFSKYLTKGNECENEAIQEVGYFFDLFDVKKNTQYFENEFICGTPDVIDSETVFDTKCSWNRKTFLDSVTSAINPDYESQLQGYMNLTGLKNAELCYVLLEFENQDFSQFTREEKFYSINVKYDAEFIDQVEKKVIQCREWLNDYHATVTLKLKK